MTTVEEKIQALEKLGHKLIEPGRQYCEYCGQAMFTTAGTKPCPMKRKIMTEIAYYYMLFNEPCNPEDIARNLNLPLSLVENEFKKLEDDEQIIWAKDHLVDGWVPTT